MMRRLAWGALFGVLFLALALPAAGQLTSCRLIDRSSVAFTPDQQRYDVDSRVTIEARLQNFDTLDYNLSLFSVLNSPTWSTSADNAPCGPVPVPATASCGFDTALLLDPSGKAPILRLQRRDILITTGTGGNNTTTLTSKGDMPKDLVVLVSGKVPSIAIQEERSFLRVRQQRGGNELCEVVRETREITSVILGKIGACFQDADSALAKSQKLMDRDARDAGLKSSDLRNEEDIMEQATKNLNRAKDDYKKGVAGGTENQSILDACNDAIRLAQRVEGNVREKIGGAGFGSFISGTVVPVILVIVVIILAVMFLGKKRWDRL